ncbi:hypothetical protein QBC38DRAFT_530284 [Podospora fimiseda]|uniref:Uncharacterized protein n=1 Tax=Podospora fimiseda TaxID=252190 RepID=A0AAN7H1I1_9PEZI|nr:hypothetical protein QBC38DRAFT_530284 [Podospora fimiseda]
MPQILPRFYPEQKFDGVFFGIILNAGVDYHDDTFKRSPFSCFSKNPITQIHSRCEDPRAKFEFDAQTLATFPIQDPWDVTFETAVKDTAAREAQAPQTVGSLDTDFNEGAETDRPVFGSVDRLETMSLFSTQSSQPRMRPSFEAEAQKLALIPYDSDDDGGVEAALLKLERKYDGSDEPRPKHHIILSDSAFGGTSSVEQSASHVEFSTVPSDSGYEGTVSLPGLIYHTDLSPVTSESDSETSSTQASKVHQEEFGRPPQHNAMNSNQDDTKRNYSESDSETSSNQASKTNQESFSQASAGNDIERNQDDAKTVYSDSSVFSTRTSEGYISALTSNIVGRLGKDISDSEDLENLATQLPSLSKGLASKIGFQAPTQMRRDVMVFLYKHRFAVAESFKDTYGNTQNEDEEADVEPDAQDRKDQEVSPPDIMGWLNDLDSTHHEAQVTEALGQQSHDFQPTELDEEPESEPEQGLPTSEDKSVSSQNQQIVFEVNWDPLEFFAYQKYEEPNHLGLPKAITLTGSHTGPDIQAMSCSDYLAQMWPHSCKAILELLQRVLEQETGQAVKEASGVA